MTQEEKAQAYDEALKRAQKQRADYQKELDKTDKDSQLAGLLRAGISAIDLAFPELVESNDERIRKELIGMIKESTNWVHKKEYITYLEKQKEPFPIPDKFSGLKSLMLQYLQSAANRKDDSEIESDTDLWGRKILDYVWKYSDEQKSVKWSEEDKKILNLAIEWAEVMSSHFSFVDMDPTDFHKIVSWLKSLLERFNEE